MQLHNFYGKKMVVQNFMAPKNRKLGQQKAVKVTDVNKKRPEEYLATNSDL